MLKKKLTKLVGLKKEDFDQFVLSNQIQLQSARLIPVLKTGDEMALTSIFLSALKLIKEFRDGFFKEISLSRSGKIYYYTEVHFKDIFLQEYNRLFNVELGLGGWENINIAHYWNIEKAIEKYRYQGKRMLIIYGAGHKGWFLRELRKRDDIKLLEMKPFLNAIQ